MAMPDRSPFPAFYMCFVDIIVTIYVQALSLRFVSGFRHLNIGLYSSNVVFDISNLLRLTCTLLGMTYTFYLYVFFMLLL